MRSFLAIALVLTTVIFSSCSKNNFTAGKDGNATLTVKPFISQAVNDILMNDTIYNNDSVSKNLVGMVYIRYNSTDTAVIDISSSCSDSLFVNGTGTGNIEFFNLQPGSYYVYFKGHIYKQNVQGGNSYYIAESKEVPIYIIPR